MTATTAITNVTGMPKRIWHEADALLRKSIIAYVIAKGWLSEATARQKAGCLCLAYIAVRLQVTEP